MFKIIESALTGKFGAEAVPSLMDVITVTPNPEMATEILLGIYEKPELPNTVFNAQGLEKTLVSADYWQGSVIYSYEEEVRKHLYTEKDIDTSVITLDNWEEFEREYNRNDVQSFYILTGEIKTKQSSCSFADWLSQKEVVVD